jgi:hypothetical protein
MPSKEQSGPSSTASSFTVEIIPQYVVRESLLDYIAWMRERGATDKGIAKALTQYGNKVIIAPSGSYGLIAELVLQPAGSFKVSDNDRQHFSI